MTVASATRLESESARLALDHLASQNLMAIRLTDDVRYQYQPDQVKLDAAAIALAESYRTDRIHMLTLMARQSDHRVGELANAFRIRCDDAR